MTNGDSFSFENNVTGGTAQINQGQNVTATQTVGGDPWLDVFEAVGEVPEGVAHVEAMKATSTSAELTDEQIGTFKDGLAWMKIQSPDAVPIVQGLVGGNAKLAELFD